MKEIYLTSEMLDEAFEIRDRRIEKVRQATETRRKMDRAKSQEEFEKISLPEEYKKFGEYGYQVMCSYVSGYSFRDNDAPKCFYGALGGPADLLIPTLYRGEIRDYKETSGFSSLGREISKCNDDSGDEERFLLLLKAQMRIEIFAGFLSHFKQFREFPFAQPRPELIAQHYGLSTQFLDLTDDIKVAMFFACCKRNEKNTGRANSFRSITENDIQEMGEDGVLYMGIADAPCIGCQPFCRCHRQRGYYLDTTRNGICWSYSLAADEHFKKYYFKRTVALSKRLYEEFEGGAALFPQDNLSLFNEQINHIKSTEVFPTQVFEDQFNALRKYLDGLICAGKINNDLYAALCNKTYVRTRLESRGNQFQEQIQIEFGKEKHKMLQNCNDNWNPTQYEEDEGIVYSPFVVIDK